MTNELELRHTALEIIKWAEAKRMMGDCSVVPDFDQQTVTELFRGVGMQTAVTTLQDRNISYIGINEAEHSIVVFTGKALRARDKTLLKNAGSSSIKIEFRHSSQLTSGGGAPPQSPNSPFTLNSSGLYTCGSSVSIANEPTAGTVGCLLRDASGELYALSNNHVFAGNNYADRGIQIIAPGQADIAANSLDPFVIGHLLAAIPMVDGNPQLVPSHLNVDAAIIKIRDPALISSFQRSYYDTPTTVGQLKPNMQVEKVGRTTDRTRGRVVSHHITPQAIKANIHRYGSFKIAYFEDIFGIVGDGGAFSKGGDSGSLVTAVDDVGSRRSVGLVFAGDENLTFAVSLDKVLGHFGLTIVGGHNI